VGQRAISQFRASKHAPHLLNARLASQQRQLGVHGILAGFGHQEVLVAFCSDLRLVSDDEHLATFS
jgi:hypothetical protein